MISPRQKLLLSVGIFGIASCFVSPVKGHPHHHHHHPHPHPQSEGEEQKEAANVNAPHFTYDVADVEIESSLLDDPLRYDADILSTEANTYIACLKYSPEEGDRIWLGTAGAASGGEIDPATIQWREVVGEPGVYAAPSLTLDSTGKLWLTYEAESDEQWDVWALDISEQGISNQENRSDNPPFEPIRISESAGSDIHHRVAADKSGGLWVVWQSDCEGQFDILMRRIDQELGDFMRVSSQPKGDWHPQISLKENGDVVVVWDAYDGDSFNVYARRLQLAEGVDAWSERIPVACTPAFEGRAQVVTDQQDCTWIAWEEGAPNWGKPYRADRPSTISEEIGPLHRFRKLHIALLGDDNSVSEIENMFPMLSLDLAQARPEAEEGARRVGAFYERAKLGIDPAGRLWVVYRHYYAPTLGYQNNSHKEQGWGVYARYLGEAGWSSLHQFNMGQGDGLQRFELSPHGEGMQCIWTTGRTDRRPERATGVVVGMLQGEGAVASSIALQNPLDIALGTPLLEDNNAGSDRVEIGGKECSLYYGDLHRHTDLSLCRVDSDGTIDDAYRYAIEVAELDFLGITDHSRDLAHGNTLSLLWWRSCKEVYRHELTNRFFPYFAYERSHGNVSDHNVISLRNDVLRRHTYPLPQFWEELDGDTFTIPHMPIGPRTWTFQNDQFRPIAEIFQGRRNRTIESRIQNGLNQGFHLGFIASSDHMSTSASYACVWAEEESRESIFRSMQARRTFGATAKIRLVFQAGEHWMGEIFSAPALPPLTLKVEGTAPIRQVDLIVDGSVVKTYSPEEGNSVEIHEDGIELDLEGEHYIYFYLRQADGNEAWSSPVWVTIGEEEASSAE